MTPTDLNENTIAYFSMEVGIDPKIPTYSGGLGILAGDTIRTAADMSLPFVAVTLLTRKGYFHQRLNAKGHQRETPESWSVKDRLAPCRTRVSLRLNGRRITIRAWRYDAKGLSGNTVPIYYLDTDLRDNRPEDRALSHTLYGGDSETRLLQEWVLGAGGVKMLRALGYRQVSCFHMNEGHAAFLIFALFAERLKAQRRERISKADIKAVQDLCVFTTHTPVPAGHDRFNLKQTKSILGPHPIWRIKKYFERDKNVLNMTDLALAFSRYVNGVSQKHGEVSQAMFPYSKIDAITNGVHLPIWAAPSIQRLLDQYVPGWKSDNALLRYGLAIPSKALQRAHQECKVRLIQRINRRHSAAFKRNRFTIGFARRATAYKRAGLIFSDMEALRRIAKVAGPMQLVFAGKAHPKDADGKQLIADIYQAAQQLPNDISLVYLPNYEMNMAKDLIPGVDLWLNTPEPPFEASGTSGMKAALNGVPSLSILDGWWIEGCVEGLTGWAIGKPNSTPKSQIRSLFQKLEKIVTLYYDDHDAYLDVMRHALALNGSYFNTQRMLNEYRVKAYKQ